MNYALLFWGAQFLALAGSVAGTWLNYWLLERMSATALLSMALVEPLIAVLLGAAFRQERVTPGAAAGGMLVLCSSFMITIHGSPKPKGEGGSFQRSGR